MAKNSDRKDESPLPITAVVNCPTNEVLPIASQPRSPRNFQDLIRYSTEAASLVGPRPDNPERPESSTEPLDDERKKFLEQAIKSLTVDVVEELLNNIKVLKNAHLIPEDGNTTHCEEALDNIIDLVDNMDVSNDFHKIGGFCVFQPCLKSVHNGIRWKGAELIAQLCQNNPYCQNKVLETGLMSTLLKMVDADVDDTVRIKALYAVSCLARESKEGLQEFIQTDGFSVLLRALQSDIQKLNIKAAFLLSSLCHSKPEIKDNLVSVGCVEQLISQLALHVQVFDEGDKSSIEHVLNALFEILENNKLALDISRRPELQFKNLLDFIVKNTKDTDQYKDENECAQKLNEIVFGEMENSDEDR